jgi:hypothetical protein
MVQRRLSKHGYLEYKKKKTNVNNSTVNWGLEA